MGLSPEFSSQAGPEAWAAHVAVLPHKVVPLGSLKVTQVTSIKPSRALEEKAL